MTLPEKLGLQRRLDAMKVGSTRSHHVVSHRELIQVTRVDEAHWRIRDASAQADLIGTANALKALWENGEATEQNSAIPRAG